MSMHISYVTMARSILARRLSEGQSLTTQDELLEAMSVLPEEKRRVYEAIRQLKRRGELVAEGSGFRYMPEAAPESLSDRIYRVIRAFGGGFSVEQISTTSEVNPDRVRNVIEALAGAEYVAEAGKNGKIKIWLATQKCRDTPTPPRLNYSQSTFMRERLAVAKLVEIFLIATDIGGPRMTASIREQLDILNRRFGQKGIAHDSQEN